MSWMGWRTPAVDFSVRVHSGLDLCPRVAGVWGGPIRFGGRLGAFLGHGAVTLRDSLNR